MASQGENLPLGLMVPPVAAGSEIPPEPPDVAGRTLAVAARLLCGATTFFFLAFLFAYIYLRSLNQNGLWRPPHEHPNQGWGAAFVACVVISAIASIVAGRQMKAKSPAWVASALGALVLGLAAVAVQCIEYTVQNFGPTDGAYASVFCGWSAFYLLAVLGAMFWLETHVASARRARARIGRGEPPPTGDIKEPARTISPGMDAAIFYWTFLAGIGVITYVTLYLV